MMTKLMDDVKFLVGVELTRANEQHPLFHSPHEGIAVIEEEIHEARAEMLMLYKKLEESKHRVWNDEDVDVWEMRHISKMLACEAIQVAAMCEKYEMSKEGMK